MVRSRLTTLWIRFHKLTHLTATTPNVSSLTTKASISGRFWLMGNSLHQGTLHIQFGWIIEFTSHPRIKLLELIGPSSNSRHSMWRTARASSTSRMTQMAQSTSTPSWSQTTAISASHALINQIWKLATRLALSRHRTGQWSQIAKIFSNPSQSKLSLRNKSTFRPWESLIAILARQLSLNSPTTMSKYTSLSAQNRFPLTCSPSSLGHSIASVHLLRESKSSPTSRWESSAASRSHSTQKSSRMIGSESRRPRFASMSQCSIHHTPSIN